MTLEDIVLLFEALTTKQLSSIVDNCEGSHLSCVESPLPPRYVCDKYQKIGRWTLGMAWKIKMSKHKFPTAYIVIMNEYELTRD